MKKEDIKKLAENKNFISGIYNYCDRWCERCPFTARCMNFAMTLEHSDDPETSDINNEKFWQNLSHIFKVTRELVEETAQEMGVDLDNIDFEETAREEGIKDKITENHECCQAAKKYYQMVTEFFESEYVPSLQVVDKDHMNNASDLQKSDVIDGPPTLDEMVEIIYWYQHFIYVKLLRAVRGTLGNAEEEWEDFPKDSDGSAKVALIAIDRSMAAWGHMHQFFPSHQDQIMDMIVLLERLRSRTETLFPEARKFVRPGFDKN
ncbi:MAG: hypothetical protein R3274_06600 [Desulfobacterales bacterium]|nr:hypothetical protein [Desulfobacterales bacterium]